MGWGASDEFRNAGQINGNGAALLSARRTVGLAEAASSLVFVLTRTVNEELFK